MSQQSAGGAGPTQVDRTNQSSSQDVPLPLPLVVERPLLSDLERALGLEWLVTNGIGGYASSTVVGAHTRRYHGLLVAALRPPLARTLMLAKLDEEVEVAGGRCPLATNEYHDGTINPRGYLTLERFWLEGTLPVWRFHVAGLVLERRIWMEYGRNTTYVQYRLLSASGPVLLRLTPLVTLRGHHGHCQGASDWRFAVQPVRGGWEIVAFPGAAPLRLYTRPRAAWRDTGFWYWRFLHRRERERGLDALEDLYNPGQIELALAPGEEASLVATSEEPQATDLDAAASLARARRRDQELLVRAQHAPMRGGDGVDREESTAPVAAPLDAVAARLVLAADQFLVARPSIGPEARSVIAGYHWFGEWGRDTMIALPGLCLATGRFEEARAILRTSCRFLDQGMLPNYFPEGGEEPAYNAADVSLGFFEALARYLDAVPGGDEALLRELYPALREIVAWHQRGTRYGIGVDPDDTLLRAGAPGVALTWMDARLAGREITPRRGKPVEINALWYNALRLMAAWSASLREPAADLDAAAARAYASFNRRFWYGAGGYLYDVVDGEQGDDPSLRPNQLVAISLHHPVLARDRWASVLQAVERALLTPVGLRTLAPDHPAYAGHYGGDQAARDSAYHQGTVWPWLIGPYVDAARRVRGPAWPARSALAGLVARLQTGALGTIGELASGDEPGRPDGCIAQAWSVAEVLRVWRESR